jgi:hypothetical protein
VIANGAEDHVSDRVKIKFSIYSISMRLDGFNRDVYEQGNLLVALSAPGEGQNL